jgi:hypothetical protein
MSKYYVEEIVSKMESMLDIKSDMGKEALKHYVEAILLFEKKQLDYGPNNISDFGEFGVLVRLNDKVNRLKNLFDTKVEAKNESIADTWKDITNYGLIGLMCHLNLWKKK